MAKSSSLRLVIGSGCGGLLGLVLGGVIVGAASIVLVGAFLFQGMGSFEVPVLQLADSPSCKAPSQYAAASVRPECQATGTGRQTTFSHLTDHWTSFSGPGLRPGPKSQGWVVGRWAGVPTWTGDTASPLTTPGFLVVDLQLGGREVPLAFDTGANVSALSAPRLPYLGLDPIAATGPVFNVGSTRVNGWGGSYPARMFALADARAGSLEWDDVVFAVIPVASDDFEGLLGLSTAGPGVLVFDPTRSRIGVFESVERAQSALGLPGSALQPVEAVDHDGSPSPRARWSLGERSGEALVDSGCLISAVSADSPMADELLPLDTIGVEVSHSSVGGHQQGRLARLEGLTVGDRAVGPLTVVVKQTGGRELTLCTDVIQHHVIVTEPARRRTWLLQAP